MLFVAIIPVSFCRFFLLLGFFWDILFPRGTHVRFSFFLRDQWQGQEWGENAYGWHFSLLSLLQIRLSKVVSFADEGHKIFYFLGGEIIEKHDVPMWNNKQMIFDIRGTS